MKLSKILLAVMAVCCGILLSSCSDGNSSMTVFITEIEKISELYLLKIYHGEYLYLAKGKNEQHVIYVGEALIGIDLTESKFERTGNKYIIKLPVPDIQDAKLIEEECKVVESEGKYFNWKVAAQKHLEKSINKKEYIDAAKEQAEELFKTIFESQGYSPEIVWMEKPDRDN